MNTLNLAAFAICLGILMGAFGAHGLEGHVKPERIEVWNTAAFYHLFNALALLVLGIWRKIQPEAVPLGITRLLGFGLVVFSGSLYALVLLDQAILGAITPIGGLALAISWAWLGIHLSRKKEHPINA
jgi:uncharacterized membrane protein YgdD (TMEM256/DUF423 family)